MLFGDGLEPRTVVYPKIVRIDDETQPRRRFRLIRPRLRLEALTPARSAASRRAQRWPSSGFPEASIS